MLGTRNSTGCWDYGGPQETQSGVDVVNALAQLPWSNGKVAMIGGSYDGTTANMVAARATAPGLAAIVPQAAISRWYGYAYQDGVRYLGNSQHPTDEGFDTPLRVRLRLRPHAADAGHAAARSTRSRDRIEPVRRRRAHGARLRHHARLRRVLARARLPHATTTCRSLIVTHGWQDYNVRQSEGIDLYAAQDGPA